MKFLLIDKIESLEIGKKIVTSKNLSLAEEYLADHFGPFPIMPGVLMLEAMTQSAAWLVRLEQDFANSIVVLKTARNLRYSWMVQPGDTLRCEVELVSINDEVAKFKAFGYNGDKLAVQCKLELTWKSLADQGNWGKDADQRIKDQLRDYWSLIGGKKLLENSGKSL